MSGTESIVHIHIAQGGQIRSKSFIPLGFPFDKTQVFQQKYLSRFQIAGHRYRHFGEHIVRKQDFPSQQLAQALRHRCQAVFGFESGSRRTSQMRHQNHRSPVGQQFLNRRQAFPDPSVVRNHALFHRHVEIAADQDFLVLEIDIFNCLHIHKKFLIFFQQQALMRIFPFSKDR